MSEISCELHELDISKAFVAKILADAKVSKNIDDIFMSLLAWDGVERDFAFEKWGDWVRQEGSFVILIKKDGSKVIHLTEEFLKIIQILSFES